MYRATSRRFMALSGVASNLRSRPVLRRAQARERVQREGLAAAVPPEDRGELAPHELRVEAFDELARASVNRNTRRFERLRVRALAAAGRAHGRVHPISARGLRADDYLAQGLRHLLLVIRNRTLPGHDFGVALRKARRGVRLAVTARDRSARPSRDRICPWRRRYASSRAR